MNIKDDVRSAVIDPARLWSARTEFLAGQRWSHALTLSYNDWPVGRERIRRDLRGIHMRIDRRLLGTNFNRKARDERTGFVAFLEGEDHHPHVHMGWRVPVPHLCRFAILIRSGIWSRFAPRGSYELRLVDAGRGWWSYITKHATAASEWISSDEFLPTA